jgi:hypothetical protein
MHHQLVLLMDQCDAALGGGRTTPRPSRCAACGASGISLVACHLQAVLCLVCGTSSCSGTSEDAESDDALGTSCHGSSILPT